MIYEDWDRFIWDDYCFIHKSNNIVSIGLVGSQTRVVLYRKLLILLNIGLMYRLLFLQFSTSLGCSAHGLSFWKTDSTSYYGPPLYHIHMLMVISRLSNWLCLWPRCLGPWMNHLPPVQLSNFMFVFLNESWVCKFDIVKRNFLLMFTFDHCLYTLPLPLLSLSYGSLWNNFFILSTWYYHIP